MTIVEENIEAKTEHQIQERLSLIEMRKQSGVSGTEVARICGTTYKTLRNWELGETVPNIVNVYELLSIYGYTLEQLDLSLYYGFNRHHKPWPLPPALKSLSPESTERIESLRRIYQHVNGEAIDND